MIDNIKTPEIFVFNPDQKECFGVLRNAEEFTEDIRFNTCSEVHLKVAKKICDPLTGKWINNPVFKHLEKNNLLYLCDDNEYFSFPNRTLRNDYSIKPKADIEVNYGRKTNNGFVSMTYENNTDILTGFKVQPETDLFNISVAKGYNWWNLSVVDELGYQRYPRAWSSRFNQVSCDTFVPIEAYDVISLRTKMYKNCLKKNIRYVEYSICFYTEADTNTYLAEMSINHNYDASYPRPYADPVYRFNVNSLTANDLEYIDNENLGLDYEASEEEGVAKIKKIFSEKGGYIRVSVKDNYYQYPNLSTHVNNNSSSYIANKKKYSSYYYVQDQTTVIGWSFPYDNWLKVYSGKRFCSKIENDITEGSYGLPLRWFVIVDTEDEFDGNTRVKNITAYSYEYTISNRNISLSEDTLPFYIPPQITDIVNSNNWIIDKEYGSYGSTAINAKQYMSEGLLNKILNILPEWRVGHISSELMTRYRKVSDINNSNLYSFLMNDVESLYQCYFVFDCINKTISAYTQEDIVENSDIVLNWQNALKSLKIKDQDKNFVTALRVHTADDTYGVGLINPTGNSIIYNFNSLLDKLDFVADTSNNDPLQRNKITENGITRNRTLKEAVINLMNFIENPQIEITESFCTAIGDGDDMYGEDDETQHDNIYTDTTIRINNLQQYQNIATKFVECNLDKIKNEAALETAKTNYLSILNKIAIEAEYQDSINNTTTDYFRYEKILKPSWMESMRTAPASPKFMSYALFVEIYNAAKQYYITKAEYDAKTNDYNSYKDIFIKVSSKTNLNYYKQLSLTNQYRNNNNAGLDAEGNPIILSLLTPAEILALQPFIREGDWTNDNSVFSEDYDAKDITTTLVDVYRQAKSDMDTFLSKPSYDFESDVINWTEIPEMEKNYKKLKVGKTLYINSINDEYVIPLLLELHINYRNKDDFKMAFTTNYKRKITELRFYDLYSEVNRISTIDSTFTFNE